jgi:ribonuclease III
MAAPDLLEQRLGHTFAEPALLRLALTHPSVSHEAGAETRLQTNQRLEFLGDAVLQLSLSHAFYEKFPSLDEGALTKARAKLVNRQSLAEHARALDLGARLLFGRGEEATGGRDKASVLADAFEAVLGAVYLDGGFEAARAFVLREFSAALAAVDAAPGIDNPKGELQELLQSRSATGPAYELVSASGPDHARVFECRVLHDGVELGRGQGRAKKEAESAAALAALDKLRTGK